VELWTFFEIQDGFVPNLVQISVTVTEIDALIIIIIITDLYSAFRSEDTEALIPQTFVR